MGKHFLAEFRTVHFGCLNTFDPQQCPKTGLEIRLMALLKAVGFVG